jgi:hypothetical protein
MNGVPPQPSTSETKDKSSLLKFGILELGILVVLIGLIIATLNYFNALPFSSSFEGFLGKLPKRTAPASPIPSTSTSEAARVVEAVSDMPGYKLAINDREALMEYLNSINFWETNFVPVGRDMLVRKVTFRLTDEVQKGNEYTSDGIGTYLSSKASLKGDTMDIFIYIAPTITSDPVKEKDLSLYVQAGAVTATFRLVHQGGGQDRAQNEAELTKILTDLGASNKRFFKVERE